jgi:hypothetical protein
MIIKTWYYPLLTYTPENQNRAVRAFNLLYFYNLQFY